MTDSHLSADREWPHWPNLDQFKHQAKDLLKAYRAGDANAVAQVNRHEQAPGPAAFALHDAQRVLARSYGFTSWQKLKSYVQTIQPYWRPLEPKSADDANRFLRLACITYFDDDHPSRRDRARQLLAEKPHLAKANIYAAAAVAASLTGAQAAAQSSKPVEVAVTIRADQPGATISRHIYGQFAEHLGAGIYEGIWVGEDSAIPNTRGYRNDVVEALRKLKVPVVRWPGGCFADEYHWREGIGPREQRPIKVNTHWGGVEEPNSFGTHEFLDFAELIGADAYVSGNAGSGTAQEMADWVEYITADNNSSLAQLRRKNGREKPWKLPFFGVGNETWGCGGNMRVEYWADVYRHMQTFVKAPQDNRPIKIASGAPVGGVAELSYDKGDRVRIRVIPEAGVEEIHLHGYDLEQETDGTKPVLFDFTASITGGFEMEAHTHDGEFEIASLKVQP